MFIFTLFTLLFISAILSIFIGRYSISVNDVLEILPKFFNIGNSGKASIIFNIRLPRIIASAIVGMGLAVSGATFQAVLNNSLASPDVLGTSSAAGFGAAIAMLLFKEHTAFISFSSFIFGLISILMVYGICALKKSTDSLSVILSGIIITSLFMSFTSAIKFVADPNDVLPAITFWLMGSFSSIDKSYIYYVLPIFLIGYTILYSLRFKMNILSLGDEEAKLSGINPVLLRIVLLTVSSILVSASVTIAGVIGWVGLVIPHLVRSLVGYNHGKLIPVSALMGAIFLIIIDDIARSISAAEIPIGILTSLIGAPIFAILFIRGGRNDRS
ncbi:FecCD family ABC transporter permease [Enterococcus gilvus]|uniref:FecCD family ABC transporter permease n=1 Tax=Enterococcus gilvus TaxID=160453 RepID=UPI003ED912B3